MDSNSNPKGQACPTKGIVLTYHKFNLELKNPFTVSYGTRTHQKTLVVVFTLENHSGYGECPEIFYYNVKREGWIEKLKLINQKFEEFEFTTPENLWEYLHSELSDDYFLLNAIDQAAHDWYSRKLGVPLRNLLGAEANKQKQLQSCFTIGLDKTEVMVQKIREEPGWPIYKIKLSKENPIEIIERLRKETSAPFLVDPNGSWSADEAILYSEILKELGVQVIEQPLAKDDLEGMKTVIKESVLPVIADESFQVIEDLEKIKGCFNGINIKISKCGGLTPALKIIKAARDYGLSIMIGCMIEGNVAISAQAQLVPLIDFADMDAGVLLKPESNSAYGVEVSPAGIKYPDRPGTGVVLRLENEESESN